MTITIDGTVGANKAVVLDSSGKLPAIDGSLVTTLNATQVTTGSIATARIDTGTTTGKVLVLDGSGNMPAIAAGAMTGVESATKSASNPTVSTNSALGTKWINTSTGAIFVCTTATTGANVWTNTGGTSGSVQPYAFQGSTAGFIVGGYNGVQVINIDEVSFTSDGAATDAGDLTVGRSAGTNTSSATHLFTSGGYGPGNYTPNTADVIESISFASKGTMVDVGNLVHHIRGQGGTSSEDYGYVHGGYRAVNDPTGPATGYNVIWRYAHVSSGNATDVGDLLGQRDTPGANSDPANSYGYSCAGSGPTNHIERYAMSSSGNSADVGDLTTSHTGPSSSSSTTHGYYAGNGYSAPFTKVIEKFAFAASGNATDVGDLIQPYNTGTGVTSTTHGYAAGGYWNGSSPSGAGVTNIDKYSFTTDGNSIDVGDMTRNRNTMGSVGGQH